MGNSNYARGRRFEWQLKKDLESQGWVVTRASGSHGIFDLIGLRETEEGGQVALIQCKTTKSNKVNPLIKEFIKKLPFKATTFAQILAVKITGKKEYYLYKHTE